MIKITTKKEDDGTTIHVEGKLCGTAAESLAATWDEARAGATPVTVHLAHVTFISPEGKALLGRLHREGARLCASGCATRGVVAEITGEEPEGCG